jgi:hypothetical protein
VWHALSPGFGDSGPWALFAGFVVGLISLVGWGIRLLGNGRLIQGIVYDDVRGQRDGWRAAAETSLAANRELADHVGRLVQTTEKLIEAQRDTEALVRTLVATSAAREVA